MKNYIIKYEKLKIENQNNEQIKCNMALKYENENNNNK